MSKLDNIFAEVMKVRVLLEMQLDNETTAIAIPAIDENALGFKFPAESKDSLEDLEYRLRSEPAFKKLLVIIIHYYALTSIKLVFNRFVISLDLAVKMGVRLPGPLQASW